MSENINVDLLVAPKICTNIFLKIYELLVGWIILVYTI
jgi:hypothetical protein